MPVPANISALSTTAGSNSPPGSEAVTTVDDYLRAHAAFIAQLRDDNAGSVQPVSLGGTGVTSIAAMLTAFSIYTKAEILALIEQPGSVKLWPAATPPTGWLAINGSAVSRTTYAALFAILGTTWGAGDGSTTFNLPPASRFFLGAGGGYVVGATGGSEDAIVVAHDHGVTDPGHAHGLSGQTIQGSSTQAPSALTDGTARPLGTATSAATTGISINSAGSSGAGANMPPYSVFLPIIKY